MSSPAIRRPVESVRAFPCQTVPMAVLRCFGLTVVEHLMLEFCQNGRPVAECNPFELRSLQDLRGRHLVRLSHDGSRWQLTDCAKTFLQVIVILLNADLRSGPARVYEFRNPNIRLTGCS